MFVELGGVLLAVLFSARFAGDRTGWVLGDLRHMSVLQVARVVCHLPDEDTALEGVSGSAPRSRVRGRP